MHTLSVSALNEQIKYLLQDSFSQVLVEGELSRITFHNSGHIYFTLKDKESAISCVMFRGNATRLKFRLKEGMKVIVNGAISLYLPRGSYQVNCFSIEPSGHGALALAYEQLKQKLSSKGYFEVKKQLPKYPKRIALITSATGAALQDMLRVANQRYKLLKIDIYDVVVQGQNSATSIVNALEISDKKGYDIIILSRGGGSIEDLWSFNEEKVADAIFVATTPIVSAIGHEIDWLISDFVADLRAPTPSAAMEMILPDTIELYQNIDILMQNYDNIITSKLSALKVKIEHQVNLYQQNSIKQKIKNKQEELIQIKNRFTQEIKFKLQSFSQLLQPWQGKFNYQIKVILENKINQLKLSKENILANNPAKRTALGFAQISKNGKAINIKALHVNDTFELMDNQTIIHSKVLKID